MTTITVRSVDPEVLRSTIFQDANFIALQGATGAQIDTFLTNNVTTLAQARPILKLLLQGLQLQTSQRD